jgi:hypothetical protein
MKNKFEPIYARMIATLVTIYNSSVDSFHLKSF